MPLNLAVVTADTQLTFTWDPPTDDGDSPIIRYNYEFGPTGSLVNGDHGTNPTGSQTLVKTGLTTNTSYTFKVRAVTNFNFTVTTGPFAEIVATPGEPTVTSIVRQTPMTSPTNADVLTWRITFSEAMSNVDAPDFAVDGTTATLTYRVIPGMAGVYEVIAAGGDLASLDATVTLSFASGHNIQDTSSNALTNTTPTGTNENTYVVENTPPRLTSAAVNAAGNAVEFVFSESLQVPSTETAYLTFFATLKSYFSLTADGSAVMIDDSVPTSLSKLNIDISPSIHQGQIVVLTYTDPTTGDDAVAIEDAAGNEAASFTTGLSGVPAIINNSTVADTTGPVFKSAAADGTSLVITFYEDLAAAASLANSAFAVKKTSGGTETTVTLSTTVAPAISGQTVTLTLVTALLTATDTAIKVSYTKPTSGTANKLVDAASNETTNFTDKPVTNNTPVPDTTPPRLTSAAVNAAGNAVEFVFSESLQVPSTETAYLTFFATLKSYFSLTADGSAVMIDDSVPTSLSKLNIDISPSIHQGQIVVLTYTDPTTGDDAVAIEDAAGNEAASFTTGLSGVPAIINNSTVADTTGPVFKSAAADGTSLVITFYEDLAAAASLANSAFAVKKTSGGTETTVTLSTTVAPAISGQTVTLTLVTALAATDTAIKVSYTKPTSGTANKLVDAASNETASFTDQPYSNRLRRTEHP